MKVYKSFYDTMGAKRETFTRPYLENGLII